MFESEPLGVMLGQHLPHPGCRIGRGFLFDPLSREVAFANDDGLHIRRCAFRDLLQMTTPGPGLPMAKSFAVSIELSASSPMQASENVLGSMPSAVSWVLIIRIANVRGGASMPAMIVTA